MPVPRIGNRTVLARLDTNSIPPRTVFTAFRRLLGIGMVLTLVGPRLSAQAGTASGAVKDSSTGQPVVQARVVVSGTTIGALTTENGRYMLRGIPPGSVVLLVSRIGYTPQKVTATIAAGAPTVVDMTLAQTAVPLDAAVMNEIEQELNYLIQVLT